MEFQINDSPELTMAEITKKLFNCNFLSDVQFCVADQTIYGHSLELMKRSTVFQKQLGATLGEKKLIPITDVPYDSAYQFFRFIYTDECDVNNTNVIHMLKLSKRYKVTKLENHLVDSLAQTNMWLPFFEYCLLANDQHHFRRIHETVNSNLKQCLSSNQFLTIHPIVIEEILKFDRANISEMQLFEALAKWITQHSQDNQIEISQQKAYYDKYLRLIRFPVMTADEVLKCTTTHPQLFNDNDYVSIFKTLSLNSGNERPLWNNQPRGSYKCPNNLIKTYNMHFETKFKVSRAMVLNALRFGHDSSLGNIEIILHSQPNYINTAKPLKFEYKPHKWGSTVLNLGESIRLQPNIEYSIQFKITPDSWFQNVGVFCRNDNVDVLTNLPPDFIHFETVSRNLIEMHFTLVTNQ